MRVIAGRFRSRLLEAPPGPATRPTSDRLRETLFNVLAPRIEGARFLDLYAGSGAVGIEALSRGAAEAMFVERSAAALAALKANLEKLGIRSGVRVRPGTVSAFLNAPAGRHIPQKRSADRTPGRSMEQFDVVFLDPPYEALGQYEGVLSVLGGVEFPSWTQSEDSAGGRGPASERAASPCRILADDGIAVAEHRRKTQLRQRYGDLERIRVLEQGDATLSFFQRAGTALPSILETA